MNAITHDCAYSFFPNATFEEYRSLFLVKGKLFDNHYGPALEKYKARGWTFEERFPSDNCTTKGSQEFKAGKRWVADKISWILPLDMTDVPLPVDLRPNKLNPFLVGSFNIIREHHRENFIYPAISFAVVSSAFYSARFVASHEVSFKLDICEKAIKRIKKGSFDPDTLPVDKSVSVEVKYAHSALLINDIIDATKH